MAMPATFNQARRSLRQNTPEAATTTEFSEYTENGNVSQSADQGLGQVWRIPKRQHATAHSKRFATFVRMALIAHPNLLLVRDHDTRP